ncbi:MAG: hypothetical protein ABI442_14800 [Gemmatimonadaceae bacterium]
MSPSHAQFKPPDFGKGDESTIGGYAAVHDRPAAFEGSDGFSYSVELVAEETGSRDDRWSAFFLFVKWARLGAQTPEGHLESDYVARGATESDALRAIGATPLNDVKELLDDLVAETAGPPERKWWDAMRDEGDDGGVS